MEEGESFNSLTTQDGVRDFASLLVLVAGETTAFFLSGGLDFCFFSNLGREV